MLCWIANGRDPKKGTIIHFHDFLHEQDIPNVSLEKIKKVFPKAKILGWKKCGDIGVRKYRIRVDFKVV